MQTILAALGTAPVTPRSALVGIVAVAIATMPIQWLGARLLAPSPAATRDAGLAEKAISDPSGTMVTIEAGAATRAPSEIPPPAMLGAGAPRAERAASPAVGGLSPQQILLVEDVATNQDLLRHILEMAGHRVDVVGNGAEAIMAVLDMSYDLVLMDLQMPHVDGLSATKAIRRLPQPFRDVPIVGVSAHPLADTAAVEAKAAGMIDVIGEPFSSDKVLATLAQALEPDAPADTDDHATLAKLAALIGDAKVRELLASLARSLRRQFDMPATAGGRAMARRHAHAAIAGAGMLGFTDFAAACRALESAPDDATFEPRLAAVRRQAESVASAALELSRRDEPLAARARRTAAGTVPEQFVLR